MELEKYKMAIIGCGWLGLPLYESLSAVGHDIVTTTTNQSKIKLYSGKLKITIFDITKQSPAPSLIDNDIIIYTIPPKGEEEIIRFFQAVSPDKKIIFISSISVYGKLDGLINEESKQSPQSKNGQLLKETEIYLKSHFKNLTIIRPGGLYAENRHPIYTLQGKVNLTNGSEFLHLVHRDNCIETITQIICKNLWSESFNLVNDIRIHKQEFYTAKAEFLGLIPPLYIFTPLNNQTNISNEKSKKILSLNYLN